MGDYRFYNPALLNDAELRGMFVVRDREFRQLVKAIRQQPAEPPLKHLLLIGARGMGKTSLGLRVLLEIRDNSSLSAVWQPVPFFEESYGVTDLAGLWLTTLKHLAEVTKNNKWARVAESLIESERSTIKLEARALAALLDYSKDSGKRLLLFIENVDQLIAQFLSPDDVHRLRAVLQERSEIFFFCTANSIFSQVARYGEPLYEFFYQIRLRGLDKGEAATYLERIVDATNSDAIRYVIKSDPGRIEVIRRFTGGNPRLIALAARMISESPTGAARDDLEKLIDEQTPYFKARIEQLPAQSRAVFHVLAAGWKPMLAREVAKTTRLSSSQASAQLKKLQQLGYVESIDEGSKRPRYQVMERFYNIYYLLRFTRDQKGRLERLIDFITQLFGQAAATEMAHAILLRLPGLASVESSNEWAAIGLLAPHIVKDPENKEARLILSEALHIANKLDVDLPGELLDHSFTVLHDDPITREEFIKAATRYIGKHPLRTDKKSVSVGIYLANAFIASGKCSEAREVLNDVIALIPKISSIYMIRGMTSYMLNDFGAAEADFLKASSTTDGMAKTPAGRRLRDISRTITVYSWAMLARLYNSRDRYEDAERAARSALDLISPDSEAEEHRGMVLVELGRSLIPQGRAQESENLIEPFVRENPKAIAAMRVAALAAERLSRARDSETVLKRIIEIDPSGTSWEFLADFYLRQKRYVEAEQAYRKILELEPNITRAYGDLGITLAQLGRLQEAEKILREGVQKEPQSGAINLQLGIVLARTDRREEAVQYLFTAGNGKFPELAVLAAHTLVAVNDEYRDRASQMVEVALRSSNISYRGQIFAAAFYAMLKVWPKAFESLSASAKLVKIDAEAVGRVSDVLIEATADGMGTKALDWIIEQGLEEILEPLVHAIRQELGIAEDPLPAEVSDVVAEVRARIMSERERTQ